VKSDVIVVLGAAEYNGVASDVLQARLLEATKIFQQGLANKIISVGSNQKGDLFTEASVGFKWLSNHGISHGSLKSLPDGIDTLSSTQAYVEQMKSQGEHSVIIVTDEYHCLRAMTMARDLGVSASCAPSETGPASKTTSSYKYLVRETGAYLSYLTLGRVGVHFTDQIKKASS
jgi:vancomycin permeability regulator SanA